MKIRGVGVTRLQASGGCLMLLVSLAWIGCGGTRIETGPIKVDPQAAAEKAIEQYDTNGDGQLDSGELAKSPALASAVSRIDTDRSKSLSAAEIAARLERYQSLSRFIAGTVTVTSKGRPVPDAEVTFEPEAFMGERYPTFNGKTDELGSVSLRSDPDLPGFPLGFYRIRISKMENGSEKIPSKFNTATTLGREIADDAGSANRITIAL